MFDTRHRAEGVVTELRAAGYHDAQIGTVAPAGEEPPESQPARRLDSVDGAGLTGALVGRGISSEDATYYEGEVAAGRFLVVVDFAANMAHDAQAAIGRHCGYGRIATPICQPGCAILRQSGGNPDR